MSGRPLEPLPAIEGMVPEGLPPGALGNGLASAATAWLDNLPGGVFRLHLDIDGRWTFLYVNAEMQRLLGMSGAGLRRDARSVKSILHPADLVQLKSHLVQSRQTGLTWKARVPVLRQSGCHTWVEVTASPECQTDTSTVWNGFLTDVNYDHTRLYAKSGLHESQMRGIQAAGLSMLDFDLSTQRLRLNLLARLQHGLDSAQAELPLLHWLDLLRPEDRDAAHRAWTAPTRHNKQPAQTVVVHLRRPDGIALRALELTISAVRRAGDAAADPKKLAQRIGVCRDVTLQRQHEEQRCKKTRGC